MDFGSVRFDCSTARYMLFLSILHNCFLVSNITNMLDLVAARSQVLFFWLDLLLTILQGMLVSGVILKSTLPKHC